MPSPTSTHTFFDPPPPGGKSIPTELRSEATELQKKMKYDDAEREGLFHIWKCFTLSVWAQKIWLLTTTSHVDERHCVVSRKVTSCILFSLSLSPPFLAFSSSFSSVLPSLHFSILPSPRPLHRPSCYNSQRWWVCVGRGGGPQDCGHNLS